VPTQRVSRPNMYRALGIVAECCNANTPYEWW